MYEKNSKGWRKHIDFILIDLVCLQLAFVIAYMIRFGIQSPYTDLDYRVLAGVYILADLVICVTCDSFKNVLRRGYHKEFIAVVKHVGLVEALTLLFLFSTQRGDIYSRLFFYALAVLYFMLTYLGRSFWKYQLKDGKLRKASRSLLIVAPKERLAECISSIRERNYSIYCTIQAIAIDAPMKGQNVDGVPVVADYEDIISYVRREWVDEVFLCGTAFGDVQMELVEQLRQMGIVTHIAVLKRNRYTEGKRQQIGQLGDFVVLTTSLNYASPVKLHLKRLIDITGSLVGCAITLVLILVIGPFIYIQSPGSIFFVQERVGKNGKKFKMYKFRTMYPDAEARKAELMEENRIADGRMFKLDYDPRIIGNRILPDGTVKEGLGSFLRKTSLDEFPQMFNVLRGDMSLVGTRPPTVDEWEKYDLHHRARLACRPGITGLWQVSGRSKITDFEEVVRLDTEYIDNWNIGLDIRILLQTLGVVVKNDGAM